MAVVVALIFGWKFLYSIDEEKEDDELNDWDIEGIDWNIDGLINLMDSEINCKT